MNKSVLQFSSQQLRRAAEVRGQIAALERKLRRIVEPAVKPNTTKVRNGSPSATSVRPADVFSASKPTARDTLKFILKRPKARSRPIVIPMAERARAVEDLKLSVRLYHVLTFNNIRTLGDLQGLKLKNIAEFRNCGAKSIRELAGLVKKLLIKAGVTEEPDEVVIRIPKSAQDVELSSLPLSDRLGRILRLGGYKTLGNLEGVPFKRFLEVEGCGPATIHHLFEVVAKVDTTLEQPKA